MLLSVGTNTVSTYTLYEYVTGNGSHVIFCQVCLLLPQDLNSSMITRQIEKKKQIFPTCFSKLYMPRATRFAHRLATDAKSIIIDLV